MRTTDLLLCSVLVLGSGCHFFQKGVIRSGRTTVIGQPDAGKPATLAESRSDASLPIPAGSRLVVTKFAASPAIPGDDSHDAVPAQPAREVTEIVLAKDATWNRAETHIQADTGTVDTSIAKHRIDAAENRFLLWASLGALGAAGVFLYLKYPTPAFICAGAAVVLFAAWKLAGLPPWFHVIGISALVGAVMLWRGHARGEADGVKAALAGEVEPKNTPVVKS